jgi:hypothetical protein
MDRAMVAAIEPPDGLLNLIYDAAAEEELWPQAMIDIADLTGSLGGFVFGVENKARMVTFTFHGRMSDESHRVYRERHVMNPLATYMINSPVGKLVRSDDILPLSALQRTGFLMRFSVRRRSPTMRWCRSPRSATFKSGSTCAAACVRGRLKPTSCDLSLD